MSTLQHIELFHKYNKGELSSDERAFMELRLSNDPEFKNEFETFLESEKLMKLRELWSVKEELDKYDYSDGTNFINTRNIVLLCVFLGGLATAVYFITKSGEVEKRKTSAFVNTKSEPVTSVPKAVPGPVRDGNKKTAANPAVQKRIENPIVENSNTKLPLEQGSPIVTIEPETQHTDAPETISPCATLLPEIATEATCKETANGIILVKRIQGGKEPYTILLNKTEYKGDKVRIANLPKGKYEIYITDASGCSFQKTLSVSEITCETKAQDPFPKKKYDYLYYASGQAWKVPDCPARGTLEIISPSGKLVYSRALERNYADEWNGENINGETVGTGVYLFKITDAETNEERTGTITVMR